MSKPMGRPTLYTEDVAARILGALSDGQSMRTVCKPDDMPCMATVWKWLHEREDFSERYVRAKQESADSMVEDMHAIADDESLDHNSRRVRVDTRKWIAARLKPKKYGDRVALEGPTDGAPLVVSWLNGDKV